MSLFYSREEGSTYVALTAYSTHALTYTVPTQKQSVLYCAQPLYVKNFYYKYFINILIHSTRGTCTCLGTDLNILRPGL